MTLGTPFVSAIQSSEYGGVLVQKWRMLQNDDVLTSPVDLSISEFGASRNVRAVAVCLQAAHLQKQATSAN